MTQDQTLSHHFLIAMPALEDPNFSRTVTYICEHNEEGALGIVINRPSELVLGDLLGHLEIECDSDCARAPVHVGGPVQRERGFVLHPSAGDWEASIEIGGSISVTTSRDILEALASGGGPERFLVALGYAGWGPGQLEQEMAENAWLSGPAEASVIFDTQDDQRWRAAAALLGVDLSLLSADSGHA